MSLDVMKAAKVGDVETVNKWLTARGYKHQGQLCTVIELAIMHKRNNICQLLLDCRAIRNDEQAVDTALITACQFNRLTIVKSVIQRCFIQKSTLTQALLEAKVRGHVRVVNWLISDVMHLSDTDRIRWTFVTACVRGDVSDIQQLATRVHSDVTSVMSQALKVACYNGRHDVVKWLTSHTTADVSSVGVIRIYDGEMTSLMAACNDGSQAYCHTTTTVCYTTHSQHDVWHTTRHSATLDMF
jgi:hypothetical protein